MGLYQYDSLHDGGIRLIHLLPGSFEDDIRLRLLHDNLPRSEHESRPDPVSKRELRATLDEGWRAFKTPEGRWFFVGPEGLTYEYPATDREPALASCLRARDRSCSQYEALSYAWGGYSESCCVYVMSDTLEKGSIGTLPVGRNLDEALRHLRSESEERIIWVDAICINQKDSTERSEQVSRMDLIYGRARRVIAWLGVRANGSGTALRNLEHLGTRVEVSDDVWIFDLPRVGNDTRSVKKLISSYNATQWDDITQLLSRPWFQRLWVLQEIELSNKTSIVQCGYDTILFSHLRRAIAALWNKIGVPVDLAHIIDQNQELAYSSTCSPLTNMIWLSRHRQCSDPRDRVYGILGLMGPRTRHSVRPSYDQSVETTYEDIFLNHAKESDRLDLLTECFLGAQSSTLPSWVPDWRGYPSVFRITEKGFQASGMSAACFRKLPGGVLEIKGTPCGIVSAITEPALDNDDESLARKLRELNPKIGPSYVNGENLQDAWLKTLCLSCYRERYPHNPYLRMNAWRRLIDAASCPEDRSEAVIESQTSAMSRIPQSYRDTLENMRFICTDSGHFGFGTMDVEVGDQVYVVLGLSTPLVVRRTKGGGHQVVGWCYIHGMMDGEILLGPLPPHWAVEQHYIHGRHVPRYRVTATDYIQVDDPRLEKLAAEWRRIEVGFTADDPINVDYFENVATGEVLNHDPRLSPEKLVQRGVRLETLRLV